MLNILEACGSELGLDLAAVGPRSPQFWHLLIEAKKLVFTDLDRYNADPRFEQDPVAGATWSRSSTASTTRSAPE
jgi:gamma-glutamyltranspeptidase/glutathione hydrolase